MSEVPIIGQVSAEVRALNTIIQQLDMLIRLQCGQVPSHVIKSRLNKFDEEKGMKYGIEPIEKKEDPALD